MGKKFKFCCCLEPYVATHFHYPSAASMRNHTASERSNAGEDSVVPHFGLK